jgi:hypothetical protein
MCSIGLTTRQRTHPFGLFGQLKPMDCQVFVPPRDVRIEHCLGESLAFFCLCTGLSDRDDIGRTPYCQ